MPAINLSRPSSSPNFMYTSTCELRRVAKSDRSGIVPLEKIVSVESHCKAVGFVAKELIRLLPDGMRKQVPDWAPFVCAAHDVGKISLFQNDVRGVSPEGQYHELMSARALFLHINKNPPRSCEVSEWYKVPPLYVVLKHHGGSRERECTGQWPFKDFQCRGKDPWDEERAALLQSLEELFPHKDPLNSIGSDSIWKEFLAGLLCAADWLGSDESLFPLDETTWGPIPVMARRAALAHGLMEDTSRPLGGLDFKSFWGGRFSPNDMQARMLEVFRELDGAPAVVVVENGMGTGKTEAALSPALECGRGLYFGLPTQVTSNKIYERLLDRLKAVGYHSITLSHGKSSLYLSSRGVEDGMDGSWFSSKKRSLLSPIGVGTADQAMLSSIPARKHHHVRLFGLAGKVLILDEVHSYDAYSSQVIKATVDRHLELGGQVIILSATLTRESREALLGVSSCSAGDPTAYPCISVRTAGSSTYEALAVQEDSVTGNYGIPIKVREVPAQVGYKASESVPDEMYRDAIQRARKGEMVLWVENTVRMSQEVFETLQRLAPMELRGSIGLLHSAFMVGDRHKHESKWLTSFGKDGGGRTGAILVSTQVCEQSVDIDADFLVSRLCPMDMLLQRVGRLWRHKRESRPVASPEVAVLSPAVHPVPKDLKAARAALGTSAYVYHPYVLLNTLRYLRGLPSLLLPQGIRHAVEAAYAPGGEFEGDFKMAAARQSSRACRASTDTHMVPHHVMSDDVEISQSDAEVGEKEFYSTRDEGVKSTTVTLLDEASGNPLLGGSLESLMDVERSSIRVTDRDGSLLAASEALNSKRCKWQVGVRVRSTGELLGKDSNPTTFRYDTVRGLLR